MTTDSQRGKLIAVIGEEETCIGFLLGGIGEVTNNKQTNFFVVERNTTKPEIENAFMSFFKRQDIAIILITQNVANMIRQTIDNHIKPEPTVLEIPSKDHPYDVNSDSIMSRAKGMFSMDELK